MKFVYLNINSFRNNSFWNKFECLPEQVKGSLNILIVSEIKLNDSFPVGQFLTDDFRQLFSFNLNKNDGGILLYVRVDIPAKLVSADDHPTIKSFYVELNLQRNKCLINCSDNPHWNNISKYLYIISKSLDDHSAKHGNVILLDFFLDNVILMYNGMKHKLCFIAILAT